MAIIKASYHPIFRYVQLFAIAIGGTISSTYFLGNGFLLHQLGPFAFLAYLAGGIITYLSMNSMAELSSFKTPTHLSFIQYSSEYLSKSIACGVGYSYWINWILYIPTECIAGGFLLNALWPKLPIMVYACMIMLIILICNVQPVKVFSKSAEWFTYTHLLIFGVFSLCALLIYLGFIGESKQFLGTKYLWPKEGAFPNGYKIFLFNGTIMLLNFQGAEIIGLAASETKEPRQEVPISIKDMAPLVTLLYVVPMLLLALIFPWNNPVIEGSVFSRALESYGFKWIGFIFSILIVCGSVSVCNSGIYALSRCFHALSHYKMTPRYFNHLSKNNVPLRITVFSCLVIFILLILTFIFPSAKLYELLLALSGFSGTVAWVSMCFAQLKARKQMSLKNLDSIKHKAPFFPWGTYVAIFSMLFCMLVILFDSDLRISAIAGIATFFIPFGFHKFKEFKERFL